MQKWELQQNPGSCRLGHLRCFVLCSLLLLHPDTSTALRNGEKVSHSWGSIPGDHGRGGRKEGEGQEWGRVWEGFASACSWHSSTGTSPAQAAATALLFPACYCPWMLILAPRITGQEQTELIPEGGKVPVWQSLHCPRSRREQVHAGVEKSRIVKSFWWRESWAFSCLQNQLLCSLLSQDTADATLRW